jgi:hypothetical protein
MNKLLVDGNIPAHTECPWYGACSMEAEGTCHHNGIAHTVDFSCGAARGFELSRIEPKLRVLNARYILAMKDQERYLVLNPDTREYVPMYVRLREDGVHVYLTTVDSVIGDFTRTYTQRIHHLRFKEINSPALGAAAMTRQQLIRLIETKEYQIK